MSLRDELERLRAEQAQLQKEIEAHRTEMDQVRRAHRLEADSLMGDPATFSDAFLEELRRALPDPSAAEVFLMRTPLLVSVSPSPESRSLARKLLLHLANFLAQSGHYLTDSVSDELHELVTAAHIRHWLPPEGLPEGESSKLVKQLVAHYQAGRHMWVDLDLIRYLNHMSEDDVGLLRSLLAEREQAQLAPLRFHLALLDGDIDAAISARGGAPETLEQAWDLVLTLADTEMNQETVRWAKYALTLEPDKATRDVLLEIVKDYSEAGL